VKVHTEKSQRDEPQAHIAKPNVHARRRTAWPDSAKVEPLGHERLLGVDGLYACAGCVRVERVVARAEGGYCEEHQRREGELDNHMQTRRK
jgi:hypothetical protein